VAVGACCVHPQVPRDHFNTGRYEHRLYCNGHLLWILVGADFLNVDRGGGPRAQLPSHIRPLLNEEVSLEGIYLSLHSKIQLKIRVGDEFGTIQRVLEPFKLRPLELVGYWGSGRS